MAEPRSWVARVFRKSNHSSSSSIRHPSLLETNPSLSAPPGDLDLLGFLESSYERTRSQARPLNRDGNRNRLKKPVPFSEFVSMSTAPHRWKITTNRPRKFHLKRSKFSTRTHLDRGFDYYDCRSSPTLLNNWGLKKATKKVLNMKEKSTWDSSKKASDPISLSFNDEIDPRLSTSSWVTSLPFHTVKGQDTSPPAASTASQKPKTHKAHRVIKELSLPSRKWISSRQSGSRKSPSATTDNSRVAAWISTLLKPPSIPMQSSSSMESHLQKGSVALPATDPKTSTNIDHSLIMSETTSLSDGFESDDSTGYSESVLSDSQQVFAQCDGLGPILIPFKAEIVNRVMEEYAGMFDPENCMAERQRQHNGNEASQTGRPDASQILPNYAEASQGNVKRRLGDDAAERNFDDNPNKRRQLRDGPPSTSDIVRLKFACPFYKRNPCRHQKFTSCRCPGFTSVARVKEHLYRRHRLPIHCPRCRRVFETETQREDHLRVKETCELKEQELPEGLYQDQVMQLKSKKKATRGRSEEDKWREVYRILFPNEDEYSMPSPYCETSQSHKTKVEGCPDSIAILEYDRFCKRELNRHVKRRLEELVAKEAEPVYDRVLSQMIDIVQTAQESLYQGWLASQHSSDSIIIPSRTTIPQGETSMGICIRSEELEAVVVPPPPASENLFGPPLQKVGGKSWEFGGSISQESSGSNDFRSTASHQTGLSENTSLTSADGVLASCEAKAILLQNSKGKSRQTPAQGWVFGANDALGGTSLNGSQEPIDFFPELHLDEGNFSYNSILPSLDSELFNWVSEDLPVSLPPENSNTLPGE